jgi:serine/threonine-protein kinase
MGEVYRARDTRLNRDVALKVLPEAFAADSERMARFEREAQMLASLNHPNIAAIYDLVNCDARQVLVLELVAGETLAEILQKGPLPLQDSLRISRCIAEALQAAHKKGIIHRDLKPANIKVTPEGGVKVLDFGLAKQRQPGADESGSRFETQMQSVTATGVIVGTPGYMSPEQTLGEAADARSDIFSFGAVLYEMLTGQRAFRSNTLTGLIHAVLTSNPVSPKRVRPEIPVELDVAVMRALRKDREHRPQSIQEFCSELDRITAKPAPLLGLAPSTGDRFRDLVWRVKSWGLENRIRSLSLAVLVVLLLGVLGWQVFRTRPDPAASVPASPARPVADADAYGLFQQGLVSLERYDKQENVDAAVRAFDAAIQKEPNYAPAYAGLGMAYAWQFLYNRDRTLLDRAVENARHAVGLDDQLAVNRVSLGCAYVARGEYDLAEPELTQALILEPGNLDAHRCLGDLQLAKGNAVAAENLYKVGIEAHPDDWRLRYALGVFYYGRSRFADAENSFKDVIKLVSDCYMVHRDLGAVFYTQGRFADASAEFQRSLEMRPAASTYSNLGTSLFFQGLYQQSVTAMEKALDLGANNYQIWANLGDAYRQTSGNEEKAREAFRAAIQLVRGELSSKPGNALLLSRLAVYLAKADEKQAALDQAKAVEGLDQTAPVLARLVLVYEICGRREQALNALAGALKQGYSKDELNRDPELLELRKDPNYHKLVLSLPNRNQK